MGCQASGWVGSTACQAREPPLAGMALDDDGLAEGGAHGRKRSCFGWMSIGRIRQTSAELRTSRALRNSLGWARCGHRKGGSRATSGSLSPVHPHDAGIGIWNARAGPGKNTVFQPTNVLRGCFSRWLVQPVAGSAGEFLPRLVQPVLLMQ